MAIIILKKGKNAQRINKETIEKEGYLQEHIYNNPDSIPLYDIKEDIRLLILAREFSTNSGPIDAIGIDREGEIYLIETKLYKNPDKRTVVAQVLDYGASLWRYSGNFSEFLGELEEAVISNPKFKVGLNQGLKDFFEVEDDEVVAMLGNVEKNLRNGNFRFVVLMDQLEDRLKDLIVFINQNSKFDLFAVELEYYKYEDYEIIIPKLFGAEVKKDVGASASGNRENWDESRFLEHAKQGIHDDKAYEVLADLYRFTKENAHQTDFGTGHDTGSFTFKLEHPKSPSGFISVFTVKTSKNGKIEFRFGNIRRRGDEKMAKLFFDKLSGLPFAAKWDKKELTKEHGPTPSAILREALPDSKTLSAFKSAILDFKKELVQ